MVKILAVIFWLKGNKEDQIYCSGLDSDREVIEAEYVAFLNNMKKNRMYGKCYLKEITPLNLNITDEKHEIRILKMCEISKGNTEYIEFPINKTEVFTPVFLSVEEIRFLKEKFETELIAKKQESHQGLNIEILNELSSAVNRKAISMDREEVQRDRLELGIDIFYDDHIVDTHLAE